MSPGRSTEHEMSERERVVFSIVLLVADAALTLVETIARVASTLRSKR